MRKDPALDETREWLLRRATADTEFVEQHDRSPIGLRLGELKLQLALLDRPDRQERGLLAAKEQLQAARQLNTASTAIRLRLSDVYTVGQLLLRRRQYRCAGDWWVSASCCDKNWSNNRNAIAG